MEYVRRLAKSTDRVTKGAVYELRSDNTILDNQGRSMQPYLEESEVGKVYWEIVSIPALDCEVNSEKTKEKEMVKIEKVTLINGMRADKLKAQDLIDMIVTCRADMAELRALDIQSKYVDKQVAAIEAAIVELTELLDACDS